MSQRIIIALLGCVALGGSAAALPPQHQTARARPQPHPGTLGGPAKPRGVIGGPPANPPPPPTHTARAPAKPP